MIKQVAILVITTSFLLALNVTSNTAMAGCQPSLLSDSTNSTCIGTGVLGSNTGEVNAAFGFLALRDNTTGQANVAVGAGALQGNTSGTNNTAVGYASLGLNQLGGNNTAIGFGALGFNEIGTYNTALGVAALYRNTNGEYNTAIGASALSQNSTGSFNVVLGLEAASTLTSGSENTALGVRAGMYWTTGRNNIAVGANAGNKQKNGSNNIAIGAAGASNDDGIIRIGTAAIHKRTFLSGVRGVNVTGGQSVVVNASGQLGVVSSSARYKQDIKSMADASNPLLQLRPVTFRYKQAEEDGSRPVQFGLIAEEVADVMPELAIYNEDGSPESVAYQVLPSLLLNEYQKQNKELKKTQAKLTAVERDYKGKLEETESKLVANEAKVEAMEAEMASMKAMLLRLAAANDNDKQLAQAEQ